MTQIYLVYIPCSSRQQAKKLACILIENKLIACANMMPIESIYWWQGNIEEGEEILLLAKTTQEKARQVQELVNQEHPYDTPCILMMPVQGNEEYVTYVRHVTDTKKN